MMSKRNDAIEVMKANAKLPMADVVKLIADKIGVTEGNAKSYYKWIVANGKAPGNVEKTARAKSVTRMAKETNAKAKAPKLIKPKLDKSALKITKPITDKTAEEIADIRNKNLARLKAVGKKYAKGQYAEPTAPGVKDFDADEAKAYVQAVTDDIDSFKSPSFLTMANVKALV
jgi:hypothetical protein